MCRPCDTKQNLDRLVAAGHAALELLQKSRQDGAAEVRAALWSALKPYRKS